MKKEVSQMTDQELVDGWTKGAAWLESHAQDPATKKNYLGESYDPTSFEAGLTRLEEIETELQKRGIKYG